jgi:uncharacterized membrane-anchored protein YitT (DUF2179 family)
MHDTQSDTSEDKKTRLHRRKVNWKTIQDYLLISIGAIIQALSLRLFLIPGQLASGGVSGTAQIIEYFTGWPIGLMILIGNIPLFILGWRFLGGLKFAMRTAWAVLVFSLLTDLLVYFIPLDGITPDIVLNTFYGGISMGIGVAFVYRGRGTSGGTDILARLLNDRWSIPISQSYLLTDTIVMLLAGFSFGWEKALYALIMIYVSGFAAQTAVEGRNVIRTALIITSEPEAVADRIMTVLGRGITYLSGTGAYSGTDRKVIYCVISRSEVSRVKAMVNGIDQHAFMVIGQAHEALGEGFQPLHKGLG